GELVAQTRSSFELLVLGGRHHALREAAFQLGLLAFKEELCIAHGVAIRLRRREAFHAGAEAAMNVVLQARARMIAVEIDLATRQQEAAMDELDYAISEIARKIGAVIGGAILAQAAGDKDLWVALMQRELDIGICLVVAQEDVEARLL